MNKSYLKANIIEAIERAKYLKNLIHRPIEYPEIIGLVEKCSSILDGNILYLNELNDKIEEREDDDIRDLFRSYRQSFRAIRTIEYFGIPALHYQTDDVKFLNKLIFKIHNEIHKYIVSRISKDSNNHRIQLEELIENVEGIDLLSLKKEVEYKNTSYNFNYEDIKEDDIIFKSLDKIIQILDIYKKILTEFDINFIIPTDINYF